MAVALIVAAGRGERLGYEVPKALVPVAGKPMAHWSLDAVRAVDGIGEIVLALPPEAVARSSAELPDTVCVPGGTFRSQSVRAALEASAQPGPVIVHDAARPLAPPSLFERALAELERSGADAVVAAGRVADTIKEVARDGRTVTRTVDRERLWAIQTPQAFRRTALERALREASDELLATATDDAWLIERNGGLVRVVAFDEPNFKVTSAADLHVAELLLAERTGNGVAR
jgi:2-C-methyl-D-erythritol 4-phosphate cytidylyltransferase